jgi:hypothetical protein
MKIIETLDEAARAIPVEERPRAKEAKLRAELEKEREDAVLVILHDKWTSNIIRYARVIEDLMDKVCEHEDWRTNPEIRVQYDALECALDAMKWVSHIDYHLKELNRLHDLLDKREENNPWLRKK